jgi:hypothetical protein
LKIVIIALFLTCSAQVWGAGINAGITYYPYNPANPAVPYTAQQLSWLNNHFSFIVGSDDKASPSIYTGFKGKLWSSYIDLSSMATQSQYMQALPFAAAYGISLESMLLHSNVDYVYKSNGAPAAWTQMDKFDSWEGANGVLQSTNDMTLTDATGAAYASPLTWKNYTYFGYQFPFDQVNLTLSQAAAGGSVAWQYWNGATQRWAPLGVAPNSATALKASGRVYFAPPSDWARRSLSVGAANSLSKYFVRCVLTGVATYPKTTAIKGDPWYNDGVATHCRGWDASSRGIVNSGELAYNTTASPGASARFLHQARISMWGSNHFQYNTANYQSFDGTMKRTAAQYIAWYTLLRQSEIGFSSIMYDDATQTFTKSSPGVDVSDTDFPATELSNGTSNSTPQESLLQYRAIYPLVHPHMLVGCNIYSTDPMVTAYNFSRQGDWNVLEYMSSAKTTGGANNNTIGMAAHQANGIVAYDDYLSTNAFGNPLYAFMMYQDFENVTYPSAPVAGSPWFWDRANRGPMAALTKHLIGQNANTWFSYNTNSATYNILDEVYIYNQTTNTITTSAPTVDRSGAAKTISGLDFSRFPKPYTGFLFYAKISGAGGATEVLRCWVVNSTTISTIDPVCFNHPIGSLIQFSEPQYLSTNSALPPLSQIEHWGTYFPAMSANIGNPNAAGHNAGARDLSWVIGTPTSMASVPSGTPNLSSSTYTNNIWRRDYTNAIVLHRPSGNSGGYNTDYGTYSPQICLSGGIYPLCKGPLYYPLAADGTTGTGVTSIALRQAEGAILMVSTSVNNSNGTVFTRPRSIPQ